MYGPPGCGKTMLAKAVAANTAASFIRVVGSEFVQKYLGEGNLSKFHLVVLTVTALGPRMVRDIGIDPPRGVLMYGPPGCGKTMLAKAVAANTAASFIRVVGSEFVQKYLGEGNLTKFRLGSSIDCNDLGPRMVRDVFRLAKENSPSIIFIDEIDAIATKRFDAQTGADREVQRILLELLNQMDGFDQSTNVKVIMATNRHDTLDPALLRPGRLDRKIEFPLPDRRQKRLVFSTITSKMNLSDDVDLEDYVARPDKISGADINAICQEVIMATNRHDTLDPALLRPGRLDRKIEFPLPDRSVSLFPYVQVDFRVDDIIGIFRRQKRLVFSTITSKMNLSDDVDLEDYVARPDKISGADINAICQEAGMHAVRENRYVVLTKDFEKAYKNVIKKDQNDFEFYK
ncbi:unnamed protein product [Cylicostephanus goldi]|uniref:AAA+ ATPase domain-containing protein n=1 Tax=Cylicostephanus goldi TaxID=71465 RepID=A0A3P7MSS2_CYLGO|nr:unnamed protein product [Cylicostephanus goldi]